MSRNGSGEYSLPGADFTNGTLADADEVMTKLDDIASALTASIAKDGQTTPTAALPMGTYNHTNVGVATARTHYARASQVADGALTYGGVAGGTADALTITLSPAITAYAIGQVFSFKVGASPNTTAATLNVNTVGAGSITWPDGTALAAGDLPANSMAVVVVQATTPVFHLQSNTTLLGINGLTTETAPATGDLFPLYDLSATANRKMTLANILSIIASLTAKTTPVPADFLPISDSAASNAAKTSTIAQVLAAVSGLTEDTGPDFSADYVLSYDNSATAAKKVKFNELTAMNLIQVLSPSAASTSVFTAFNSTLYRAYVFEFDNMTVSVDDNYIQARVSIDAGSTYRSTAADYEYAGRNESSGATTNQVVSLGATFVPICGVVGTTGIGNSTNEKLSGALNLIAPDAGNCVTMEVRTTWRNQGGSLFTQYLGGRFIGTNDDVDGIQFSPGAGGGTFSGTIYCYGILK